MTPELKISEIYKAQQVLKDVARHPKLIGPVRLTPDCDCDMYLKPENLQYTGSFKLRGAYYKISQLSDEEKKRGVIACSAGNHAQGVALGAKHNGIRALICLPAGAPISKIEATKALGAEVCLVPGVYDDAYNRALELRDEQGLTFVHPFDDPLVIAGQGTIGLEIIEEMPDVEAIVVPVGGGGLISGVAFAVKTLRPDVKIYGVQAAGAPSMVESVAEGEIKRLDSVATIADGIAVKQPGDNTYALCSQYVDQLVTVTDDEISAAILALIEKQKLVAEGAGATSVAAVMFDKIPVKGKRVVCLVSGGNIDVTSLNRVITRGMAVGGRMTHLTIHVTDTPGQLASIASLIAREGGNVISVTHERSKASGPINSCAMHLELETRDNHHIDQLMSALRQAGFDVTVSH